MMTLEQLHQTPTPMATATHSPIPHGEFMGMLTKAAKVEDLELYDHQIGVVPGKAKGTGERLECARLFGVCKVRGAQVPERGDGYSVTMGFRNSHDKSFSAWMGVGSSVWVCDNLLMSATLATWKKHTNGIRINFMPAVMAALQRIPEFAELQDLRFGQYRQLEMTTEQSNSYFMRAGWAGVLAPNRVLTAANEYAHPAHSEFATPTLWSAMNAITEVQKGSQVIDAKTGTERTVGAVDAFRLPETGRALTTLTDDYARRVLGDSVIPECTAADISWMLDNESRAMALAS